MASRRNDACTLADAAVVLAGNVRTAVRATWEDHEAWWAQVVELVGCGVDLDPGLKSLVRVVLQQRLEHPDPFDSFPRRP